MSKMKPKVYLQLCFITVTVLIKDIKSSDFQFISTTEKPTKSPEDVKFLLAFVEIKVQQIIQQNENIRNEILNKIEENQSKIENKSQSIENMFEQIKIENNKQLEDIKSEISHKKMLEEIETRILTKIQEEREEILKNKKLLKAIEANVVHKIEEKGKSQLQNQEQLQQMETRIINKIDDKKDVCSKQQTEIFQIGSTLEIKNQNIENKLEEVLDKVKKIAMPRNCQDVLQLNNLLSTGVYTIQPNLFHKSFEVLCNMDTREGGWTYILNRFDGSQDFYLGWEDFKNGFGSLSGEFWLGMQHVYELTSGHQSYKLLIELVDWENVTKYALYDNFHLGDETEKYKIKSLGSYNGDAGDYLRQHINYSFLTKDRDSNANAVGWKADWWYPPNGTIWSLLFGHYNKKDETNYYGALKWGGFHGYNYSLKEARMMIKPKKL